MELVKSKNIRNNPLNFYCGKYYRVIDNSFQNCLSDGRNHSLAGMQGQIGQIVEIVRQPYLKKVEFGGHHFGDYQFIIGKCQKGLLHEIVYHRCGLIH